MIGKNNWNNGKARILVVDDDKTVATTLRDYLAEQGYEVATAFSGEEAIVQAAVFSPDLLVSDICMGALNGVETATAITAMSPDCRVLFLSGVSSMYDVMSTAPKRLVYSFMSKSVHPLDLLNAIAYMVPNIGTMHDSGASALDRYTDLHSAIGMRPVESGFILSEA